MSLRTFVKVSSVNNLSDARYCAGMGVNLIGFNIDPESEDPVSPADYQEITEWISGIDFAGEFETDNVTVIRNVVNDYKVEYIQVSHLQLLHEIGKRFTITCLHIDQKFIDIRCKNGFDPFLSLLWG